MAEIICDECGGVGQAEYEVSVVDYQAGGYLTDKLMECEKCQGSGEIEVDEPLDSPRVPTRAEIKAAFLIPEVTRDKRTNYNPRRGMKLGAKQKGSLAK